MKELDGSRYSGSGTIVRQAVSLAALTGTDIRITNVRSKRPNPGLRPQHTKVVAAIAALSGAEVEGNDVGSFELGFRPGRNPAQSCLDWDIGSAGSTVLMAQALIPILAARGEPAAVRLTGGVFQDFAPSFYHFQHCLLPLLGRMGLAVGARMLRPGYVPAGQGIVELEVQPPGRPLRPLVLPSHGAVQRIRGIALASHLEERRVAARMAEAARALLEAQGLSAEIEQINDDTSVQPGAAFAVLADAANAVTLGADRAGAPGRRAEAVAQHAVRMLLEDLRTDASVDRFVSDQLVVFAALADGRSSWIVPRVTDHVEANAWLVNELLGAKVTISGSQVTVEGAGFKPGIPAQPEPLRKAPR